jgi:hypothetical protein
MYLSQENNSHPQNITLLKNAQANATSIFFKRVLFSPPKEKIKKQKISHPKKSKTSFQRTVQTQTDIGLNVNYIEKSGCKLDTLTPRTDRRASGNSGLAKVAVQCSADTFVVNQSLVLRINISGKNRHLRQAAKRWW